MKKIVVILLLILPFVLIYSISFTGRILSEYTHIYVERLALLDENANEYAEGATIKLGKGETYTLRVKVFPELASNQEFTIGNSDKTVCEINEETCVLTALNYGTSEIVLTSKDTPVTFSFSVRVSDDDIQEIQVNKTQLQLGVGKSEELEISILPITTLAENRNIIFSSDDTSIAKVNSNGKITAVSVGETWITVRSDYKEDVFTKIKVTVVADKIYPVGFNTSGGTYTTSSPTLDLTALTVINVQNYTDLTYKVTSNIANADVSQLENGIITFTKTGVYKIVVSLVYDGQTHSDTLTVLFKENTP